MNLFIDLETRSTVDLTKCGAYVYADDPTTEILVAAWAIDDGPIELWTPKLDGAEPPIELVAALSDPATRLVAHNASFERTVISGRAGRAAGLPDVSDVRRWDCTAARAAAWCLPRSLEGAGRALGLAVEKDKDGHALMLKMCKPRKALKKDPKDCTLWHETPEQLDRLAAYCARDVRVEHMIWCKLPDLSATERQVWELTERINDRGIPVDVPLLSAVLNMIGTAEERLNTEIAERTFGLVKSLSDNRGLTQWLTDNEIDDHIDSQSGKASVAKQVVAAMIDNVEIDPLIRAVLMVRRDGGGSSVKKWRAILQRLSADGRLRGSLVYCGASGTGRWSSRGAQLQNMPRGGTVKRPLDAIRDILDGCDIDALEICHGPPMIVASELLRPAFIAPGGQIMARGDSSQIEARVNPWLAGARWKLDAFRAYDAKEGPDLYRVTAASIIKLQTGRNVAPEEVSDTDRQSLGKVPELALGYGGGSGAFQAMARAYGVKVSAKQAEEIKEAWRAANPEIVGLWRGLDKAAVECMSSAPGRVVDVWTQPPRESGVPRVRVPIDFKRNREAMRMMLPSGRPLIYWTPRLERQAVPWGFKDTVVYRAEDSVTKRWLEFNGYGGLWDENADQATARDLMSHWLLQFEPNGLEPVLTVHDEGTGLDGTGRTRAAATAVVTGIMRQVPPWAAGLPVSAEASAGPRYIKEK